MLTGRTGSSIRGPPLSSGDWATATYDDVERIVFAKFRDPVFGSTYYRFLGVFRVSAQEDGIATFSRVATEIRLPAGAQ